MLSDKIHFKVSAGLFQTPTTSGFRATSGYNRFPLQLCISVILFTGFTHKDIHENILRKLKVRKKINLICVIQVWVGNSGIYAVSIAFNG